MIYSTIPAKNRAGLIKFIAVLLIIFIATALPAQQIAPFQEGDRAVFLGNSITDGGHYHSYIWLYYMTRFPGSPIRIFNAGIGGDRAPDMYKRLDGDVFSKQPTVLMVTFGMNDSGYYEYNGDNAAQYGKDRLEECYNNYQLLEKRLQALPNVRVVMIGGSPYDQTAQIENTAFRKKNDVMLQITDFQEVSAQKNHWEFVDFNRPMTAINEREQKTNPAFTLCGGDRIHPENDGHMVMAYLFLKAQGFSGREVSDVHIDAAKKKIVQSGHCRLSNLKVSPAMVSFDYLAESLPYPLDTVARGWMQKKSQREATKVVPFMEEMNQEKLKVSGLKGTYRLSIDEIIIGEWTAEQLAEGINLAAETNTPQYRQALSVMYLNEERWEIERRFRDYAWVQFNFFQSRGLLFANNAEARRIMNEAIPDNPWPLGTMSDVYTRASLPEVRESWERQMDLLIDMIYTVNQPLTRKIVLKKING
ncbi:MAG: SGNH/GDSL hydrolase family protein [Dysgonamonadaceae bacterium]|jgi:lysophospholipase L1-like esterase|nr:SGNH/GDSL hydrolase family protein [Dysgonamonadaceae bacterium]